MTPSPVKPPTTALSGPQKALRKLGLLRDIDLALHLPLRYEDETRIVKLRDAHAGDVIQIEATLSACEVRQLGRRKLLVTVDDGSDTCTLRFFSFYPSQQKALAVGQRIRARGEIKSDFLGWQMLHPAFHPAVGELPTALTPVYPTVAGLPQAYLRRAVQGALARADLPDTIALEHLDGIGLPLSTSLRATLLFLHYPSPDVALATLENHSHPAWQRLKLEELLAQQLSQLQAKRAHNLLRAPVLKPACGNAGVLQAGDRVRAGQAQGELTRVHIERRRPLHEQLLASLPFALTSAQRH